MGTKMDIDIDPNNNLLGKMLAKSFALTETASPPPEPTEEENTNNQFEN